MTGWVLLHRNHQVTDPNVSSDATRAGACCNFHWFSNRYRWSLDQISHATARLKVDSLMAMDPMITLAVDDTLCHKRGLGIFGVDMHHDAQPEVDRPERDRRHSAPKI